jgi:hypothetical protein
MTQPIQISALFVYGSLLDPALRKRLLGRQVDAIPARLDGYERRQQRYLFILRCDGAETEGALLRDLSDRDLEILDAYEEVPALYTRELVQASDGQGMLLKCWTYIATEWAR